MDNKKEVLGWPHHANHYVQTWNDFMVMEVYVCPPSSPWCLPLAAGRWVPHKMMMTTSIFQSCFVWRTLVYAINFMRHTKYQPWNCKILADPFIKKVQKLSRARSADDREKGGGRIYEVLKNLGIMTQNFFVSCCLIIWYKHFLRPPKKYAIQKYTCFFFFIGKLKIPAKRNTTPTTKIKSIFDFNLVAIH